jgi:hypothetical protein
MTDTPMIVAQGRLITAKAEARNLAAALEKLWLVGLYAPGKTEIIAEARRDAAAALERINANAAEVGIEPKVVSFRRNGNNFRDAPEALSPVLETSRVPMIEVEVLGRADGLSFVGRPRGDQPGPDAA